MNSVNAEVVGTGLLSEGPHTSISIVRVSALFAKFASNVSVLAVTVAVIRIACAGTKLSVHVSVPPTGSVAGASQVGVMPAFKTVETTMEQTVFTAGMGPLFLQVPTIVTLEPTAKGGDGNCVMVA